MINRVALELTGVNLPKLALTRNDAEFKETLFRQTVVLLAAFVLAPFHAKLFGRLFSRGFEHELMKLSYKDLGSSQALKKGIERLALEGNVKRDTLPVADEALRKKLVKAKTNHLMADLTTEALVFANLGWIKNAFSKLLTGKEEFTGEMGTVDAKQLDKLYERRKEENKGLSKRTRHLISLGMATALPLAIGLGFRKSFMQIAKPSRIGNIIRRWAPSFDYKKGYLLGFGSLVLIGIMDDAGEFLSSRSPDELRESVLKRLPVTVSFLFGDRLLLALFSFLKNKKQGFSGMTVQKAIEMAQPSLKASAAKQAAMLSWLSFLINMGIVSSTIILNNRYTARKLKNDVMKLDTQNQTVSQPVNAPGLTPPSPFKAFENQRISFQG